jgi:hypothetical protein
MTKRSKTKKRTYDGDGRAGLAVRRRLESLLRFARGLGYVVQVEVGKPAPHRQAVTPTGLYLRPLDGSDQFCCSCCGSQYEPRLKSRLRVNYLPLNWCHVCRERLREGESEAEVYLSRTSDRRGLREAICASERRIAEHLRKAGSRPGPTHAEATAARDKKEAKHG